MISQSYNKKDRIVNLPPPLQAIGDDDESDQFLVQWLGDNKESQYTCTGISLISQREINGKSTGRRGSIVFHLGLIHAWKFNESTLQPTRNTPAIPYRDYIMENRPTA